MKKLMHSIRSKMTSLWKDEAAQGATEYILLLVIVVGIAMIFGPQIKTLVKGKIDELSSGISSIKADG